VLSTINFIRPIKKMSLSQRNRAEEMLKFVYVYYKKSTFFRRKVNSFIDIILLLNVTSCVSYIQDM
jgi:hypothetical protein